MSETRNVLHRLNKARQEFHSLKLQKTGHNKFAGYNYFELGDFLIPALEVFSRNGLSAMVSFMPDVATMTIRNVDAPDDFVTITSPMGSAALKGCHEVQNIGAVETYQRRYLWVAALEIVEHDALDATTGADQPKSAKPVTKDVWDNLPADEQTFLQDIANEAIRMLNAGNVSGAVAHIDAQNLDADEKVALWSRFDSKQRSAMKKIKQPTPQEYAEQA